MCICYPYIYIKLYMYMYICIHIYIHYQAGPCYSWAKPDFRVQLDSWAQPNFRAQPQIPGPHPISRNNLVPGPHIFPGPHLVRGPNLIPVRPATMYECLLLLIKQAPPLPPTPFFLFLYRRYGCWADLVDVVGFAVQFGCGMHVSKANSLDCIYKK